MGKICSKCKTPKPLVKFGKNKKNKDGLQYICKDCRSGEYKEQKKKWRENNIEKLKEYQKKHKPVYNKEKRREEYLKNKEKENKSSKKWNEQNKEKLKECSRQYRINHPINKSDRNFKRNQKFKSDPLYKITHKIRGIIYQVLKNRGYKKNGRTENILGCTFEEFKLYIENQFEEWMNWNNHGTYTGTPKIHWQIDHIIPMASAKTLEDIIRLNHYTNLQPLDSYINQVVKRDKVDWNKGELPLLKLYDCGESFHV